MPDTSRPVVKCTMFSADLLADADFAPHTPVEPDPAPDDSSQVAALMAQAVADDAGAWAALVERFSGMIWAIARAHWLSGSDASEISHRVWLRLVEHLDRIDQPGQVGVWLAWTTHQECLGMARDRGLSRPGADVTETASRPPRDDDLCRLVEEPSLWRAVDRLPVQWRSLIRLVAVVPRMSHAEMAAALDLPVGSIGPMCQRCLNYLKASPELMAMVTQRS